MKLISPGLRDDVDEAFESAAVLGLVAARLDLDLLHELVVDRLALDSLKAFVVLTPSMIHWFSAEVAP